MKKITWIVVSIVLFAASVEAADKIRIGFPELAVQFLPLPLGEKRGFFKEEGLQAEFIRMTPPVALAALTAGEIDYYTAIGPGVAATIRGIAVKAVAGFTTGAPFVLVAKPEFKSVSDLRGKAIAVNTYGSPLEVGGRLIVKHFGIDPDKEIKFLATGLFESRLASVQQGLSAAAMGSTPFEFFGAKLGLVVLARALDLFNYPASGLVATTKKIKERPDEIKRVIKAGVKANRYIHRERDGAISFLMEWLKLDKQTAGQSYDSLVKAFQEDGSVPEDGLRLIVEESKRLGKVERDVPLNEVADLSILREAQKELGIKVK
jgi:ABC-type nitrate/sulfonate/bicarbonate transport system substrate-binding protein